MGDPRVDVASFMFGLSTSVGEPTRRRWEWNARLRHWERPASDTEEAQINRAAAMVRDALAKSAWLRAEGVTVTPQGSYHNNTNVRLESDMDLSVRHPGIRFQAADGIDFGTAYRELGYSPAGRDAAAVAAEMRFHIHRSLADAFGVRNIEPGKKAFRVRGVPNSRVPVDVVPALSLHVAQQDGVTFGAAGQLNDGEVASFLIECLAYTAPDDDFMHEEDRLDRMRRILLRVEQYLASDKWRRRATEINGVKFLFGDHQPGFLPAAQRFVGLALRRLET